MSERGGAGRGWRRRGGAQDVHHAERVPRRVEDREEVVELREVLHEQLVVLLEVCEQILQAVRRLGHDLDRGNDLLERAEVSHL